MYYFCLVLRLSICFELYREKIRGLIEKYEGMLISQLDDQRLYFEKKLARATVQALEGGLTDFLTDERDLDDATSSTEAKGQLEIDTEYLDQIAGIKMEISSMEHEYSGVLQDIRGVEETLRTERRAVDALAVDLKQRQAQLKKSTNALSSLQARHQAYEEELEQELRDLHFYVRTQAKVQESPLREEIKGGGLIVTETTPSKITGGGRKGRKQHR